MRLILALMLLLQPLSAQEGKDLEAEVRRLIEVYSLVEQQYADPIDPQQVFYHGALPGMLQTLDPHTAFLDPEQFESLKQMQNSVEKGFGSVVSLLPGRVIVLQVLPDSPSARSGLSAGDEIVGLNGYSLSQLTIDQLVALLGHSRQDKAQLMVKRPGIARLMPMTLVPAEMADPSVPRAFPLRPGVGYIKVGSFEGPTAGDLHQAIEDLGGHLLKGLVLDLRGNPGGIVEAALQSASFFLQPGQRILWIRAREGPQEEVTVPEDVQPYEFPLCVLIDQTTASSAEILAGALQDHDRATIIGLPSYGKGIVQSVFDLSEGTAVALTTAKYFTPSGRSIQKPLENCEMYALLSCQGSGEEFKTDEGRTVRSGGGITPDQIVTPRAYTRFETVMEASNSFFEFAQRYLAIHPQVDESFDVPAGMLDDFQLFLSERRIRPDLSEWSLTRDFIRQRLKQEVFNLKFGVAKGDEVEVLLQPPVLAALKVLEAAR
jgi:carboxyl-terminal processing protease